ncbi:O-methyltransferase family 2 protein [Rutstroemia sp. NJR-2017a BVV2]|nr:O-methyltransferase family 2 protein [Rutstroemia sp. NJR-2017a BVV2]
MKKFLASTSGADEEPSATIAAPLLEDTQARASLPVYAMYHILTIVTFPDLEMPQPRHHHELFVLSDPITGSGISHYVTGALVSGMHYESKPVLDPEQSEIFHSKEYLGTVQIPDYPHEVDRVWKVKLHHRSKKLSIFRG